MGSSPHMRGILHIHQVREILRDHPRTCGAYSFFTNFSICNRGSSPHMRGIRTSSLSCKWENGIIPAHAGHTRYTTYHLSMSRDHPRTCGAYIDVDEDYQPCSGSSPHMRGIHEKKREKILKQGIIPAHAGHTLKDPYNRAIFFF